jgi:hypothetical protein
MEKSSGAIDIATLLHPADLQQWMETLPFADVNKSAQIIEAALRQTNTQAIKPAVRFDLLQRYSRSCQNLIDTYLTSRGGGLHSVDTKQQHVESIRRLAHELAAGYRLAIRDALASKSIFQAARPPAEAVLLAMKAHGNLILLDFHRYTPIPKSSWKDLHSIYALAERLGDAQKPIADPADSSAPISPSACYRQILAIALADPYRLPFGAVWEIHDQLRDWIGDTHIYKYNPVPVAAGYFVIDLNGGEIPLCYAKFQSPSPPDNYRILDFRALHRTARQRLDALDRGKPARELVRFAPLHARFLLEHLNKAWGLPPQRHLPRHLRHGAVSITCGIRAAYFFVNGDQEFDHSGQTIGPAGMEVHGVGYDADAPAPRHDIENWNFHNESAGGYSIYTLSRSRLKVRVGDLTGMRSASELSAPWALGVIRWLIMSADQCYRVGIQVLATSVQAATIKPMDDNIAPQRAFLVQPAAEGVSSAIVTGKGLYRPDRAFEIEIGRERWRLHAGHLFESTTAFDCFTYQR